MKKKKVSQKAINFIRVYPEDYETLRARSYEQHIPLPQIIHNLLVEAKGK